MQTSPLLPLLDAANWILMEAALVVVAAAAAAVALVVCIFHPIEDPFELTDDNSKPQR